MLTINQKLALDRVIVKHLIDTMAAHGWKLHHVWDGKAEVREDDIGSQLDAVFAVDESQLIFESQDGRQHWVDIALNSESINCIRDYGYAQYRADNFKQVMKDHVDPFISCLTEKGEK